MRNKTPGGVEKNIKEKYFIASVLAPSFVNLLISRWGVEKDIKKYFIASVLAPLY